MSSNRTVLLDYGMGNLRSVENACQKLGYEVSIQTHIQGAEKVILPGVGAFGKAMESLAPIADDLRVFAKSGQPFFGICLGQQLLLNTSEEFGGHQGLGIIPGSVKYFPKSLGLKVPQMGWNRIANSSDEMFTSVVHPGEEVYFVHSLYTEPENSEHIAARTQYGIEFASALQMDNVWATQFHPEKSGEVGLRILEKFLCL